MGMFIITRDMQSTVFQVEGWKKKAKLRLNVSLLVFLCCGRAIGRALEGMRRLSVSKFNRKGRVLLVTHKKHLQESTNKITRLLIKHSA